MSDIHILTTPCVVLSVYCLLIFGLFLSEIQIPDHPVSPVVNLGSCVMTLIQNNIQLSGKAKACLYQGNFAQLLCLEN